MLWCCVVREVASVSFCPLPTTRSSLIPPRPFVATHRIALYCVTSHHTAFASHHTTPASSISTKQKPTPKAVHNNDHIKKGTVSNQYHQVATSPTIIEKLASVTLRSVRVRFRNPIIEEKGRRTSPTSRLVSGWWGSHMTETLCATSGTISTHSRSRLMPVRRLPQTRVAIVLQELMRTVTYRMISTQRTRKLLWSGQQKEATRFLPGVVRATCSRNRAATKRIDSGTEAIVPGRPQRDSWRTHHAVSGVVLATRLR
mmetsp:Transcript_3102/g.6924  ORF Transcript_3102/g.6924 Transcript_3102/m.6924 type:complete len:257 (-) Transcript_3102:778-1548(-)